MTAVLALSAAGALFGSCTSSETHPGPQSTTGAGGSAGGGGGDLLPPDDGGPPPLDAQGLCGNQLHQIIFDAPNVYFVIDASGSMADKIGGSTKASIVHKALVLLVRDLGPLVNVGAAVFPHPLSAQDDCGVGAEVMSVRPGDVYTGTDGPTTNKFKNATNVTPNGGTPTAATLDALRPGIKALPGKTVVLLVTDGGPNCNDQITCDASGCGPNVEGCSGNACCDPGGNCCTANGPSGPGGCIDKDATVAAVSAYKKDGLPLYVVGIPGSEAFSEVLKSMAIAAGTAQQAAPFYYAVTDLSNLDAVLGGIASVAISCTFAVQDPPMVGDETNVYLDGVLLPSGGISGWHWTSPDFTHIELLGDSCNRLKQGKIKTVQIVSGCPTEPSK